LLGCGVTLGRVCADFWFVLLASGSDDLPRSYGVVMSLVQVSLVNDCGDADQDEDGTCGVHCFGVVAIGEL
jgi:hypothetical protein